jgi:two-component system NtrC family sensor kinase
MCYRSNGLSHNKPVLNSSDGGLLAVRGFRTKIAFHVFLLVLVSALITDVLVIWVVQGALVRNHLDHQRSLMQTVGWAVLERSLRHHEQSEEAVSLKAADLLEQMQWPSALIINPDGRQLYAHTNAKYPLSRLQAAAETALRTGQPVYERLGLTWAAFWWRPETVLIALPISSDGRITGGMAAIVSMAPLYALLRRYNAPVFIYIGLNTLLLSIVGLYRIFRIYLRPIDRIVRQADDYGQDEDLFFAFRQEDNELNRLSSALNRMVKRISEDKNKLRETVASLEKANEEIKRAQNEIIRAEKMASVGRLAAGIAHEIGNPIGIVLGYLDLLKQLDLKREEHDDFVGRAEKEIQRINTVIHQLLDLARPKENASQVVSAHEVIADIAGVMAHQPIMAEVQLHTDLRAADDRIWADADQLRQVFLNLLLNAADAIRTAGRGPDGVIRIGTDSSDASIQGGALLDIAVEDNGAGIGEDRIENIFDPFYTTKEPGKGTGLGLAVSYMIIEKMGGAISVQSRLDQGTTFIIHLPSYTQLPAVEPDGVIPIEPYTVSGKP